MSRDGEPVGLCGVAPFWSTLGGSGPVGSVGSSTVGGVGPGAPGITFSPPARPDRRSVTSSVTSSAICSALSASFSTGECFLSVMILLSGVLRTELHDRAQPGVVISRMVSNSVGRELSTL